MQTEMSISNAAAKAALALIEEYLKEGGAGMDEALLIEVRDALGTADRIVIKPNNADAEWDLPDPTA